MIKKSWKITGYDGLRVVFEQVVPKNTLSEKKLREVLLLLQARHLTEHEVILAGLQRGAARRVGLLNVRKSDRSLGGRYGFHTDGSDWHYAAYIFDQEVN